MYISRYRRCCCQKNYNNNILESECKKCGINDNLYETDVLDTNISDDCKCGYDTENSNKNVFPENPVLGQSYVPIQYMDKTFKPCVGLKMGTLFPELVNPYYPCQSMEENAFIKAMNTTGEGCNKC